MSQSAALLDHLFISQYIEKRTRSGDTVVTGIKESGQGLGFCLDFTPDKTVGVATEQLLVGSQDVAHDCAKLKELGITHILNVAYGVPNAFTDVSFNYKVIDYSAMVRRLTMYVTLLKLYTSLYIIIFQDFSQY